MKYLIPEGVLILVGFFFTKPYIELCIYLFKFIYQVTSIAIFLKPFMAFPFVTMLIFISIGCLKQLIFKTDEHQTPIYGLNNFLKKNIIFIVILIAFLVKALEAVGEDDSISPYWVAQYGAFDLVLNMVGLFCISSVVVHLFFSIKSFFKN